MAKVHVNCSLEDTLYKSVNEFNKKNPGYKISFSSALAFGIQAKMNQENTAHDMAMLQEDNKKLQAKFNHMATKLFELEAKDGK